MMRRSPFTEISSLGPAAAALVLCFAAATAAAAAEPAPEETVAPAETPAEASLDATPTFWGGLWVFVDPATGQISSQPTAEQAAWRRSQATPNPMLNKSSEGLVPFALDDGGRGFRLDGRFRHSLSVTLQPDGTFSTHCSDHPDAVAGRAHDHPGDPDHGRAAPSADEAPI
ncbi:MAG: hypothetical protein AAFX50_18035, partial [Acidobacteriota bacterium]